MNKSNFINLIQLFTLALLTLTSWDARAELPWKWQDLNPGISVDKVLRILPKAKLITQPASKNKGRAVVGIDNVIYAGGPHFIEFEFADGRLTSFVMRPHLSLPQLGDVAKFVDALRNDAIKVGGKKKRSTINYRVKNQYGEEVYELGEWQQSVRCMPFSNDDVAEISANFSAKSQGN